MNDKLNKKLAEWAGFKFEPIVPRLEFQGQICGLWRIPNTKDKPAYFQTDVRLPNFTESLDACFEWLVPNIKDRVTRMELLVNWAFTIYTLLDEPALALCLAIEKLIDSRED